MAYTVHTNIPAISLLGPRGCACALARSQAAAQEMGRGETAVAPLEITGCCGFCPSYGLQRCPGTGPNSPTEWYGRAWTRAPGVTFDMCHRLRTVPRASCLRRWGTSGEGSCVPACVLAQGSDDRWSDVEAGLLAVPGANAGRVGVPGALRGCDTEPPSKVASSTNGLVTYAGGEVHLKINLYTTASGSLQDGRPLIHQVSAREEPSASCLVPGSCPGLPGRHLKTRNTVQVIYSMLTRAEHRKAPVCGDEQDGRCWGEW